MLGDVDWRYRDIDFKGLLDIIFGVFGWYYLKWFNIYIYVIIYWF